MTVTTLPIRPPHGRLTHPPKPAVRRGRTRRRMRSHADNAPTLTVTFELTWGGDTSYIDAVEVLDALREINHRLRTARTQPIPTRNHGDPTNSAGDRPTVHAVQAAPQSPLNPFTPIDDEATIQIQADARDVSVRGVAIALTRVEFDLLLFLAVHPRRVFTRAHLLESVWGYANASERTVDVHIRRLRSKLGNDVVTTVRGIGYRLADDADLRMIQLS
jgi:two-component system response regulator MtrA